MPRRSERNTGKEPEIEPIKKNKASSSKPTEMIEEPMNEDTPVEEDIPVTNDMSELEEKMRKLVLDSLQDSIPTIMTMLEKPSCSKSVEKNQDEVIINLEDNIR